MAIQSSLFSTITPHRILIIGAMLAVLGVITYYSSIPPTSPDMTDRDNQMTGTTVITDTGEMAMQTGGIETWVNHNTGTIPVYPTRYLVETNEDEASCTAVRVEDDKKSKINIPTEIQESLNCVGWSEAISHNYRFLLYTHSTAPDYKTIDLKTYDFTNKKIQTLMSFNNTIDGMSCQRRDDDGYIACVVINQTDYAWSTKVFILQINTDGSLAKKQVFPQSNDTRVGFHCASSCYPSDFRWEGTRILQYEWQDNGDDILTGKTYSITYE